MTTPKRKAREQNAGTKAPRLVTDHKYDRHVSDPENALCDKCGLPREAHSEAKS